MSRTVRALTLAGAFAAVWVAALITLQIKTGSRNTPLLVLACVIGASNALFAVGLVLIYRASRVINFAHAGFGLVSATLFVELVTYEGWSYWFALPVSLLAGAAVGALMELVFVRRFFKTPRLVVAVVTIGVSQLLVAVNEALPRLMGDTSRCTADNAQSARTCTVSPPVPKSPFGHYHFNLQNFRFTGDSVVLVVAAVAALAALGAFFRYSSAGIAVRGAAMNDDRASELGINTRSLSTLVWLIAAGLSAIGAVLLVPIFGAGAGGATAGTGTLLIALAAAVIGGMDNLPITVVASLALAIFQQVVYVAFRQSAVVDAAIFGVILIAFVAQRRKLARADEASTTAWAATEEVRPIPAELARLPVVRNGIRRLLVVLGIVVFGYPFVMSPSQTNIASYFLISGIVIISLVILTGWGGQISLGQFAFVGMGALIGGGLTGKEHWPFGVALLLGALAGAVLAVAIGLFVLRVRGLYLAVTTLAFAVAMATVGLNRKYVGALLPTRVNRPELLFLHTEDERVFYYFCVVALGLAWYAALGLRRTRTGRVLIGARDNERAAQAFGVNLVRTRLITFAISGFMAAAAGVLLAAHQHSVSATAFSPDQSIQIFLTAVIGGLGSIQGALLGAVYFAVVNIAIHGILGRLLASSLGVLVVLMFFPGGLGSLAYQARDGVLRRIAIRRKLYVPSLLADHAVIAGLTNRAPLTPRPVAPGAPRELPEKYRQRSRIRVAGESQLAKRWTYS